MDTSALNVTRTWFDEHLSEALDQLHHEGHSKWFAKSLLIPSVSLLAAFANYEGFGWYLSQPDGTTQLCLGLSREWQWDSPQGLTRMQRHTEALLREGLAEDTLVVGGLSFSPASRWSDWPGAYSALPMVQITQNGRDTRLSARLPLDGSQPPEYYRDKLDAVWQALAAAAPIAAIGQNPVSIMPRPSRKEWMERVREGAANIRAGRFEKVVLARALALTYERPLNIYAIVENLRAQNPEASTFAVRRHGSVFLGATPELLARVRDHHLEGMSLAGSASRGLTPEEDSRLAAEMKENPKIIHEHAVVRRHIQESLHHLTLSLDMPETPSLKRLPTVQHLHTPLEAELRADATIWSVIGSLHPTPAVAGYPVDIATHYIVEHGEPFPRGWYAGAIGWSTLGGDGQWMVSLRSGVVRGATVELYAGCGIMGDSVPEAELAESDWKFSTMLGALEIESELR